MQNRIVLAPAECEGMGWHVPINYSFAAQHALIPVHGREVGIAASSLPLAIRKQGRELALVAVCGLTEDANGFVTSEGDWSAGYRPAWLYTWPFETVAVQEKALVLFNTESGLLDTSGNGQPFFDDAKQLTPAVKRRVDVLRALHSKTAVTDKAIQALAKAKVLAPWSDSLTEKIGMQIEGLHLIDERALAALDDEAFLGLRRSSALALAYAINVSLANVKLLKDASNQPAAGSSTSIGDIDSLFGEGQGEILKFNF